MIRKIGEVQWNCFDLVHELFCFLFDKRCLFLLEANLFTFKIYLLPFLLTNDKFPAFLFNEPPDHTPQKFYFFLALF